MSCRRCVGGSDRMRFHNPRSRHPVARRKPSEERGNRGMGNAASLIKAYTRRRRTVPSPPSLDLLPACVYIYIYISLSLTAISSSEYSKLRGENRLRENKPKLWRGEKRECGTRHDGQCGDNDLEEDSEQYFTFQEPHRPPNVTERCSYCSRTNKDLCHIGQASRKETSRIWAAINIIPVPVAPGVPDLHQGSPPHELIQRTELNRKVLYHLQATVTDGRILAGNPRRYVLI
ncbi:hypothetical protein ALC57_16816 [Trachymyrmex cornetzi]|uniref:Uncharacterized protein n=1 Tax=Trachymyrmex cornetzi TaxID=471704 RepID=A0A151IUG2_9HYME|nr:hypothetical protein ALC57_16816 [Trachymyrmex cornetzi]